MKELTPPGMNKLFGKHTDFYGNPHKIFVFDSLQDPIDVLSGVSPRATNRDEYNVHVAN